MVIDGDISPTVNKVFQAFFCALPKHLLTTFFLSVRPTGHLSIRRHSEGDVNGLSPVELFVSVRCLGMSVNLFEEGALRQLWEVST